MVVVLKLNCVGNRLITCTWCLVIASCLVLRCLSATTNFMTKSLGAIHKGRPQPRGEGSFMDGPLVEVFINAMSVGIGRSRGPKFWGALDVQVSCLTEIL